jgi:subtilisin family serine protease
MRRLLGLAAGVLLLAGLAPATAAAASPGELQRVIVQVAPSTDARGLATAQVASGGRVRHVYAEVLDGFAAELPAAAVEALRRNPRVTAVVPDTPVSIDTTQPDPTWGLDRVDQRSGRNGTYDYDTTGAGVTVYVVDSGIRSTHEQFGGRARSGWDWVDRDSDASDCNGHGTHVAGTVGGRTYGVAKGATLVSLRVFDCAGQGYTSDVIAAFDWAFVDRTGPAVINYSGGGPANTASDEAVARTTASGLPVVVAAGNEATDACTRSPARASSAITVGATTSTDARAAYSNYGGCVDLFAPGSGVVSSYVGSDIDTKSLSGTSMAAPHVTGAVARYLQTNPTATASTVASALATAATPGVVGDGRSTRNDLLYLAPPAGARVEESAGTYSSWSVVNDPGANGGTWRTTESSGSTATYTFRGTQVSWVTRKGPRQGIASVKLDGVSRGSYDLYSATAAPFSVSFANLSSSRAHTLVITVTGRRNAASAATGIVVDAFRLRTTTVQESANAVRYGTWKGGSSVKASGGLYRSSAKANATMSFTFTGTQVAWLTTTGPGWGRAQVSIDGNDRGTVDLYAPTARWQTAQTYSGLSPGGHTITIRVLGTKNAAATSTKVAVDGFVVG